MTATFNKPAGGRLGGDELTALVRSAAAGDIHGWDALVDEFGGLIWGVARAHRLCEADAADVAQTTWLRLVEHLDHVHEPSRVGAWLATTARRECLRVLRGANRQVPIGDHAPQFESPDAQPLEELLIAERDRTVPRRDQALWRSFERLRASGQALLRLLIAEPRPAYEEISAALEMPIGSIGSTRARALERLCQQLDSEGTLTLLRAAEEPW